MTSPSDAELKQRVEAALAATFDGSARLAAAVTQDPDLARLVSEVLEALERLDEEDVHLGEALVVAAAEFFSEHLPEAAGLMSDDSGVRILATAGYAAAAVKTAVLGTPAAH